jgi:hypothetical protein
LRSDEHALAKFAAQDVTFDDGILKLQHKFIGAGSGEDEKQALPEVHSGVRVGVRS